MKILAEKQALLEVGIWEVRKQRTFWKVPNPKDPGPVLEVAARNLGMDLCYCIGLISPK